MTEEKRMTELEARLLGRLVEVADLMAQELREFVDEAQESSGSAEALASTQALLEDWDTARGEARAVTG